MTRYIAPTAALALAVTGPLAAQDGEGLTHYRAFVADHAAPRVTAIDLSQPDNRWAFEIAGAARVYSVDGGAAVAAVQADADTVHFFTSGVVMDDHGDHRDIEVTDPAPIDATLTGPRPFHLVDHDGHVAINFDRGGYVEIAEGHALSEGAVETTRLTQDRAHHGFAAPVGGDWIVTVASDEEIEEGASVPRLGVRAVTAEGDPAGDLVTCTAIHGEAFSGAYLAAGCEEGILTVTSGGDGPVFEMLDYPGDLPEGEKTGTLLGATGIQMFLGNYGDDGLVVVDPAGEPHFRFIELPFRRVTFALDPARPDRGFVLTEDGTLHRLDLLQAQIAASATATAPYSMDGHWSDPRPRLAMAGDEIVVTDPNAGLLRRISAETLEEAGTIEMEGMPYNITVVGGSGVTGE